MTRKAPVAVLIPTYNRGKAVFTVLEKIEECDPSPTEILVHIDQADGILEAELSKRFPTIRVLTSPTRLGPGGSRHRCLVACNAPYAVSFDDDSYPVDADFFGHVEQLFRENPNAAIFGANIWHRHEPERTKVQSVNLAAGYVACGFAIRLTAYRGTRGFLSRPIAYGMEESDLSLQLFSAGWHIYAVGDLRVFHDTELKHHESSAVNAAAIVNTALFAFLHFPTKYWGWGLLSVANRVIYCIRVGRFRGICMGLLKIPVDCYRYRHYRKAIDCTVLKRYLDLRRTGSPTQFGLTTQDA